MIPARGSFISHRAWNQSRDRIHNHCRAQFTAAQNVVANRKLPVSQKLADALIDTFISAADQELHDPTQRSRPLQLIKPVYPARKAKSHFASPSSVAHAPLHSASQYIQRSVPA